MPIAGFDPSITHFGWVILDENLEGKESLLDWGVFKTTPKDGLLTQRLIMQRERIRILIKKWDLSFISMEAPYWGDYNTELLFALNQYIHEVFLENSVFVVYFQPDTLKKYANLGISTKLVTKHHMVHAAKTELNLQEKRFSEHVADSYFAGKFGHRFYNWFIQKKFPDSELSEEELHVFCNKHTFTRGEKKGTTEYRGIIYKENDQFFDYKKHKKPNEIKKEIENGR